MSGMNDNHRKYFEEMIGQPPSEKLTGLYRRAALAFAAVGFHNFSPESLLLMALIAGDLTPLEEEPQPEPVPEPTPAEPAPAPPAEPPAPQPTPTPEQPTPQPEPVPEPTPSEPPSPSPEPTPPPQPEPEPTPAAGTDWSAVAEGTLVRVVFAGEERNGVFLSQQADGKLRVKVEFDSANFRVVDAEKVRLKE